MQRMPTRTSVLVTIVALGIIPAMVVGAPPATADVLISHPDREVCVGTLFRPGVWYQQYSGGPRSYRIKVVGPHGHVVMRVHGRATTRWRYFPVRAAQHGRYTTTFRPGAGVEVQWRSVARTRAVNC